MSDGGAAPVVSASFALEGREVQLETGWLARQADAAVLVRHGKAVVLCTVASGPSPPGRDFLPLTVEYREKAAAAGRIPGGFLRREGRISDAEVLASRILDRSLRPLFPKAFRDEVQVQATVLSADPEHDETPLLALVGASAALHLSALPWNGPLAGLRLVHQRQWIPLPTLAERQRCRADLVVAAGPQGLVMVEGGADELPEAELVQGLSRAQQWLAPAFEACEELRRQAGQEKRALPAAAEEGADALVRWLDEHAAPRLDAALFHASKQARSRSWKALCEALVGEAAAAVDPWPEDGAERATAHLHRLRDRRVRQAILEQARRLDGRGPEDIRAIECRTGWLPSPHGSAVFTRGETQALVSCTLAGQKLEQSVETLHGMDSRRFLLHYNFPPYSVGETRPLRGPGRREIGHGSLALRALEPVLPERGSFPYTIRVESDITSSNGSSSMATVCGASLALHDAGVPLRRSVAGIAMGLVVEGERFCVLSDILGDEDHLGDMDFKVTGTAEGITAVQMDNKVGALPEAILEQALEQARRGRRHILECMERSQGEGPATLKEHAPRVTPVRIAPGAMGELIGPRGATIKEIQQAFDVQIDVAEDGHAYVHASDQAKARQAIARIRELAGVVREGHVYEGTVTGVKEFGAFVRIYKSAEGLVPAAEWQDAPVGDMAQATRVGQRVSVRVLGVDSRGRLRLSRREAQGEAPEAAAADA